MGKTTKISWTRSTFNPWIGCQAISPGCDHCYAEAWARRTGRNFAQRKRTADGAWKQPLSWNKTAEWERRMGKLAAEAEWAGNPGFWPVFPSLCDPFDNEVPEDWRRDWFRLILATPNLTWLLLTKRIGNAARMLPWSSGSTAAAGMEPWPNVWLGISVCNQEEANRDVPKLLSTPARRRFVSYEPALGAVNFTMLGGQCWTNALTGCRMGLDGVQLSQGPKIDQIIVGGESDQASGKARMFVLNWARAVQRQCAASGVAFFMKQFGSYPVEIPPPSPHASEGVDVPLRILLASRAGDNPSEWPRDLRVQEFPK